MKKVTVISALIILFVIFAQNLLAYNSNERDDDDDDHHSENHNSCNQIYKYEKHSDYSDSRVIIDFSNNDRKISVSAKSGYKINKVWLDVEDDNHSGFYLYSTSSLSNFDPNPGKEIEEAKVEVSKICPTASPSPTSAPDDDNDPILTPTPTVLPTEISRATDTPKPTDQSTPSSEKDICLNLDGIQSSLPDGYHFDNDGINCLKFELGEALQPNGIGGGEVLGLSTSPAQVLGASTLGETGVNNDYFFNLVFKLGAFISSLGIMRYAQKNTFKKIYSSK